MEITSIKPGQTLVDVATEKYGHVLGLFWLLEDNGIQSVTDELSEGTPLLIRDEKVRLLEIEGITFQKQKLPNYKLGIKQSFFDVVIENQASMEGAFDLMQLNGYDGLTEHLFVDQEIQIKEEAIAPRVREYLTPYMPIATIDESDKSDGIGFMYIEKNFLSK